MGIKEQKFYKALDDVFIGVKIEGDFYFYEESEIRRNKKIQLHQDKLHQAFQLFGRLQLTYHGALLSADLGHFTATKNSLFFAKLSLATPFICTTLYKIWFSGSTSEKDLITLKV